MNKRATIPAKRQRQKSLALNPTITEPVAPEIESDPDVITLTISEVDRQTAENYYDRRNCLVCTVLRNRGFNIDTIAGTYGTVEDEHYALEDDGGASKYSEEVRRPFYGPEVVGKVIRLRKVKT